MCWKPIALLILVSLSGCANGTTVRTVSDACLWVKPIEYDSAHDTPETVAQIEALNVAWLRNCEGE